MFTSISMTGSGMLTLLLAFFLGWLGLNAEASQAGGYVDAALKIVGLILTVIGQLKRQDLTWGIFRRQPY